jgi:hypothetical protein
VVAPVEAAPPGVADQEPAAVLAQRAPLADDQAHVAPVLRETTSRPTNLPAQIARLTRTLGNDALERRVRELNALLEQLRPWQLTPQDDEQLRQLFLVVHDEQLQSALGRLADTLRRLAVASRERRIVIPSIEQAQAAARTPRRSARRDVSGR